MTDVQIIPADSSGIMRIESMMQFFNYDLSEFYPISFAQSGNYILQPKEAYWAHPETSPFLIHVGGELAGFAVVDGEVIGPSSQFNMGYFFVARRYRSKGVGRIVTGHIFRAFPGRWEIYHLAKNQVAAKFWRGLLASAATGEIVETLRPIHGEESVLFQFSVGAAG